VSLHVPLTAETEGLMGRSALVRMKQGSVLVNTARGGLVDEAALLQALTNGRLRAAGLNVLAEEPPPPDHPFLALANVVLRRTSRGSPGRRFTAASTSPSRT
jgi:phosphoglycerate dehydrogenase-like enzyme